MKKIKNLGQNTYGVHLIWKREAPVEIFGSYLNGLLYSATEGLTVKKAMHAPRTIDAKNMKAARRADPKGDEETESAGERERMRQGERDVKEKKGESKTRRDVEWERGRYEEEVIGNEWDRARDKISSL